MKNRLYYLIGFALRWVFGILVYSAYALYALIEFIIRALIGRSQ